MVPADTVRFYIPEFFSVVDDDVNELEQFFAIVAEIGEDIPENICCFKTEIGSPYCYGRHGAAKIIIIDNDRKYGVIHYCLAFQSLLFSRLRGLKVTTITVHHCKAEM